MSENEETGGDGTNGSGAGAQADAPELTAATPEERIAAEFENFKKRARKSELDAVAEARERVLKDMLEVVDNLERATAVQSSGKGTADGAAVLQGVNLVLRVLQQKLERYEVRPFDAKGQPFDPRVHEAISRIESADVPAGSVATELQKGYKVGERLLRPAMVSVSTGPKADKSADKA